MSQFKPNADLEFSQRFAKPNADLEFSQRFAKPNADLEFGEVKNGIKVTITLPLPKVTAEAIYLVGLELATATIKLPLPTTTAKAEYDPNVWRGLIGTGQNKSELAKPFGMTVKSNREKSLNILSNTVAKSEKATYLQNYIHTFCQLSQRLNSQNEFSMERAKYLQASSNFDFETLDFISIKNHVNTELARYVGLAWQSDFALLSKVSSRAVVSQEFARYISATLINKINVANWLANGYTIGFEVARLVPYATKPHETGTTKLKYRPNADLNFTCKWVAPNADLNFGAKCQPQDKRKLTYDGVIIVSSDITLTNLDTGKGIEIFSGNIGIDNKSYCWTLSADLAYFEKIEKGTLVELVLNSTAWRFIIDDTSTGKVFGETTVNVTGKSQAMLLAYPFTDLRGYKYTQPTSAVQIAQAEIDRVGGFELDWRLIDANGWNIPANTYSYTQYAPIQAIQDIANAGGGFVNAHPSEKKLIVKSDYPVPSWEWDSLRPDVIIPDDLYWNLDESFSEKPNYNAVWVMGERDGSVMGKIVRTGTDGSITPDQVIHPAITEQSVAIHRGMCELSQAGITVNYSMTTPLHADIGILTPSDFITFIDAGVAKNAIVRGVNIRFNMSGDGKIDIQNQLKLESKVW